MNELIARCANQFIPKSETDFVGENVIATKTGDQTGARLVARHITKAVRLAEAHGRTPLRFLFNGNPGLGKSAMCLYLQQLLQCNKWNTTKYNGTQLKIDTLEELAAHLHYTNLFGEWRLVWIDELDALLTLPVAQMRFLTLMDELPAGVAVAATCNCSIKKYDERFQTRFQCFEFAPPPVPDIQQLLVRCAPTIRLQDALQIATFACGNVRAAQLEALGLLQQAA